MPWRRVDNGRIQLFLISEYLTKQRRYNNRRLKRIVPIQGGASGLIFGTTAELRFILKIFSERRGLEGGIPGSRSRSDFGLVIGYIT
jgi:hypothetical protein